MPPQRASLLGCWVGGKSVRRTICRGSIPSRDRAVAADSPIERAGEAPCCRILGSIRLSVSTAAELRRFLLLIFLLSSDKRAGSCRLGARISLRYSAGQTDCALDLLRTQKFHPISSLRVGSTHVGVDCACNFV